MNSPTGQPAPQPLPQPGLQGVVEPGSGRGVVRFYRDVTKSMKRSVTWTFESGRPWTHTGSTPFAWDWLPAVAERHRPQVRLVAARHVRVSRTEVDPFAGREAAELAAVANTVELYRPQNDRLVPAPGEVLEPERVIGEPHLLGPPRHGSGLDRLTTVIVAPQPAGVEVRHVGGLWDLVVSIDDPWSPAAFAYEIDVPAEPTVFWSMRIVHTRNVTVRLEALRGLFNQFTFVDVARVERTAEVPPQGEPLSGRFRFGPLDSSKVVERGAAQRELGIFAIELAIGLIPFVGALYGIAQFAYAAATGEDFWGRRIDDSELLVMGVFAMMPIAVRGVSSGVQQLRQLRRLSAATPLGRLLDDPVVAEVHRLADPHLLEAVGRIDPEDLTRVFRSLGAYATGRASALAVLQSVDDAIAKAYLDVTVKRRLARIFAEDMQGFRDARLAGGYADYVRRGGRRDVVSWALAQRGRSRYAARLRDLLGDEYPEVLRRARRQLVPDVGRAALAQFDRLAGRVEEYRTLAKANRSFGHLYEVDHLVEQRFWRNNPRLQTAFDEAGDGFAVLVPRDAAVAARMPGLPMHYVHTTKTAMMRALIPHGAEAQYTLQQIYDAHAFTMYALGAHPSIWHGRMRDMFRIMGEELGEKVRFVVPARAEMMLPDAGWPVLAAISLPPPRD